MAVPVLPELLQLGALIGRQDLAHRIAGALTQGLHGRALRIVAPMALQDLLPPGLSLLEDVADLPGLRGAEGQALGHPGDHVIELLGAASRLQLVELGLLRRGKGFANEAAGLLPEGPEGVAGLLRRSLSADLLRPLALGLQDRLDLGLLIGRQIELREHAAHLVPTVVASKPVTVAIGAEAVIGGPGILSRSQHGHGGDSEPQDRDQRRANERCRELHGRNPFRAANRGSIRPRFSRRSAPCGNLKGHCPAPSAEPSCPFLGLEPP